MRSKYMQPRSMRREFRSNAGRFKGGKLAPVAASVLRESESAVLRQRVTYELDPVAGRMITEISADVIAVYVPALAIDALKNPSDDYPGNAEVFRQKLLSGATVFDLEPEGEISQRCGINPRPISGTLMVNEAIRIAHNAAVNFLRQRKYVKATQLLASSTAMTPALVASTVLDRLNAVLDPEDRVNGAVNLSGNIPVKGIGLLDPNATTASGETVKQTGGTGTESMDGWRIKDEGSSVVQGESKLVLEEDADNAGFPGIFAELSGADSMSLSDFYTAEKMDRLTREMRELIDKNPQYGEELVNRFAHGLDVDVGNQPFVLYEKTAILNRSVRSAMDGANLDVQQTDMVAQHEFTVPVPRNEFGGVIITFASVRPDEVLASQPHPIASDVWAARNYVADELAVDPVPVTVRDLYSDADVGDENTVTCYVGNNHLLKTYMHYGFTRNLDPLDVEDKTALWQLEVPMSVTPDSVIYPETLSHYPFNDQNAEVVTYTAETVLTVATPIIFGPVPVEELAEIETSDIFEDA
jgi:hypothetical protein